MADVAGKGMASAIMSTSFRSAFRAMAADGPPLDELAAHFTVTPLADAAAAAFPRLDLTEEQARKVAHGVRLPAAGLGAGPAAVFGPDGALIALMREEGGQARPLAVFVP